VSSAGSGVNDKLVLLVDDDENILDFLGIALQDEGYEVLTARHGAAALESVAQHPPRVIVLDLWMPVMDGWEFLREYRALPGPHAAIIALTAAQYDTSRSTQIEAEAFLTKPFSLDSLIQLVDSLAQPS
jgi:CheY-like chemotaxis protein